jgi:hypothetical protein
VALDGSGLATPALERAVKLGGVLDERVMTTSVIPAESAATHGNTGWLASSPSGVGSPVVADDTRDVVIVRHR